MYILDLYVGATLIPVCCILSVDLFISGVGRSPENRTLFVLEYNIVRNGLPLRAIKVSCLMNLSAGAVLSLEA